MVDVLAQLTVEKSDILKQIFFIVFTQQKTHHHFAKD